MNPLYTLLYNQRITPNQADTLAKAGFDLQKLVYPSQRIGSVPALATHITGEIEIKNWAKAVCNNGKETKESRNSRLALDAAGLPMTLEQAVYNSLGILRELSPATFKHKSKQALLTQIRDYKIYSIDGILNS